MHPIAISTERSRPESYSAGDVARGTKGGRRSIAHKPPAFGRVEEHLDRAVREWDGENVSQTRKLPGRTRRKFRGNIS